VGLGFWLIFGSFRNLLVHSWIFFFGFTRVISGLAPLWPLYGAFGAAFAPLLPHSPLWCPLLLSRLWGACRLYVGFVGL